MLLCVQDVSLKDIREAESVTSMDTYPMREAAEVWTRETERRARAPEATRPQHDSKRERYGHVRRRGEHEPLRQHALSMTAKGKGTDT